jgi:hypothetical protein
VADFTEDDVRLLADELEALHAGPASFREDARSVLEFLAARGRLLPPAAKVTDEYAVRVDEVHPARTGERLGWVITHFGQEKSLRAREVWRGWTPVQRRVITSIGPWVPVSDEEAPDGRD